MGQFDVYKFDLWLLVAASQTFRVDRAIFKATSLLDFPKTILPHRSAYPFSRCTETNEV